VVTNRVASAPTRRIDNALLRVDGVRYVIGLDEVGRGSWAGPLAVGAAIIPQSGNPLLVRDSKKIAESVREAMFDDVNAWCDAAAVGMASAQECDQLGMVRAQEIASARAIELLGGRLGIIDPDWRSACQLLVDGPYDFVRNGMRVTALVKGDNRSLSIAAASVIAKVTRDRLMRGWDDSFPAYNFWSNKGYPCRKHQMALRAYGLTAEHRRSWSYVDGLPWSDTLASAKSGDGISR
jgi:ribonuclease HII